ncbi:YdcH family protein [Aquipseudomonas campi]
MPLEHHPLSREFPEYQAALRTLMQDAHFAHLAREYQSLDAHIYEVEAGRQEVDDLTLQGLKLKRVTQKDVIADLLKRAAQ